MKLRPPPSLKSERHHLPLPVSAPGDRWEQDADRAADRALRSPGRVPACAGRVSTPEVTLDAATRAYFEPRFGFDFSRVRIHSGTSAEESASAVNARAYTIGPHIVFGANQFAPETDTGRRLLAHELAHVIQNASGAPTTIRRAPDPGATATGGMTPGHARGYAGEQSMGFGYSQEKGWILVEGPSGSQGHGVTTSGFDGVAYNVEADELHLIDNKSLKSGKVYSATAITENLVNNLDNLIAKVQRMSGMPMQRRILQLLQQLRSALTSGEKLPGKTKLIVTGESGRAKAVSTKLKGRGVEFREAGTTDLPPKAAPEETAAVPETEAKPGPAATRQRATPEGVTSEGAAPEVAKPVETSETPGAVPKGRPGIAGRLFGVAGFALPLIAGFIHQHAVRKRIEERAHKEGYVPRGAPSGEGLLYDLGSFFLDPGNDADKAVSLDKRFHLPVWRQHVRDAAAAKKPGETIKMQWDVGKCEFDIWGNQVVDTKYVTYKKQPDGSWKVESGDAHRTPDLNDIISPSVSDQTIRSIVYNDPCSA